MKLYIASILFFLVEFQPQGSLGIDEESAKERPCFNVSKIVLPDEKWAQTVKEWYFPMSHRLELYRDCKDLAGTDFANIPEYSVYYDSCSVYTMGVDKDKIVYTLRGFNGKKRIFYGSPTAPGIVKFWSEWSEGSKGTAYTTLTDNKTFIVNAVCYDDNQMTWSVISSVKKLSDASRKKISDHVESMGFKKEFVEELKYDTCPSSDSDSVSGDNQNEYLNPPAIPATFKTKWAKSNWTFCKACKEMCPKFSDKINYYKTY